MATTHGRPLGVAMVIGGHGGLQGQSYMMEKKENNDWYDKLSRSGNGNGMTFPSLSGE